MPFNHTRSVLMEFDSIHIAKAKKTITGLVKKNMFRFVPSLGLN